MISDPTRRRLIDLLGSGERQAGDLAAEFDVSFSAISQHLRILSESNVVISRREGRRLFYCLQPGELDPVAEWVAQYATAFWKEKLGRLGSVLDEIGAKEVDL